MIVTLAPMVPSGKICFITQKPARVVFQSDFKKTFGEFDRTPSFAGNLARQWFDASPELRSRFEKLVFPDGIVYVRAEGLRTAKLGCIYELNQRFGDDNSSLVDLGVGFWNRFAVECDYLVHVMREYERDKVNSL